MDDKVTRRPGLDALFRFKMPVSIDFKSGDETKKLDLWMRVLSEGEVQERSHDSAYAMAKKRNALADPNSEDFAIFVAGLEHETDETIRKAVLNGEVVGFVRELQLPDTLKDHPELDTRLYPFPDNPTDDETTDVIGKREAEPARVNAARAKWIDQRMKTREKELAEMSRDQLLGLIKTVQKDAQGRAEMERAFNDYTICHAVYTDEACQQRMFQTPAETNQLPREVRALLLTHYFKELDILTATDLKYFFTMVSPEPLKA